MDIPLVDFSDFLSDDAQSRDRAVRAWRDALDAIGFVIITGHGVPAELTSAVYKAGRAFFTQAEAHKLAYSVSSWGARRPRRLCAPV